MKFSSIVLLLVALVSVQTLPVSIFYCGFGADFCGQSTTDDVNPNVKYVILAFANPQSNGSVLVDDANFPTSLVKSWQSTGKKVLISVGGQNGNWGFVFATNISIINFVQSLSSIVASYNLDGVDLDIENYQTTPRIVADTIILLRSKIGSKLIIVSPEDVAIIQTVGFIPTPDTAGQAWNYFVPIVNLADSAIDFYQPQAYNNGYDSYKGGSAEYLQDVYLNWRNLAAAGSPIIGYNGIDGSKLLIGLQASTSAGGSSFYANASAISQFKSWISANNHTIQGFMIWDSHWDANNGYAVSNACSQ